MLICIIKRGNEEINIELKPDINYNYYLGIYFKTAENTLTNNLYYAVFKGSDSEVKGKNGYTLKTTDTAVTTLTTDYNYTTFTKNANDATRKHVVANKGELVVAKTKVGAKGTKYDLNQQLNQYLDISEAMTYTIILWVDETGSVQNDQGKQFAGTVKFTTEGNGTGVTGDLSASS